MNLVSFGQNHSSFRIALLCGVACSVLFPGALQQAFAQTSTEQVIVTGTRTSAETAGQSLSPIDVIDSTTLTQTGAINLADALVLTNPSISTNAIGSDTGELVSSIRLRGLDPNDTLVLVDGKRRHTTADVYPGQGPQQGSTPVDLNMIPADAIDHIEVLRDGAAAQYGSDAIGGVVNVILKRSSDGLNINAQTGGNPSTSDGWQGQIGLDQGFTLGDDGYLNVSGQIFHSDHHVYPTIDNRSIAAYYPQYASYNINPNSNKIASQPQEQRETASANFGLPILGGLAEAYGLLTYGRRASAAYENYRTPNTAVLANGSLLYPNGFVPQETNTENDYAGTFGFRGKDLVGFTWDLSTVYGANENSIYTRNSANTGLLSTTGYTPTSTHDESFVLSQWTTDLDLTRQMKIADTVPMTLALGGEFRQERYAIGPGELASYTLGGTQAFPGLLPSAAGHWDRHIWAAYIDDDIRPLEKLDVDLAGRVEHYTDSGDSVSGKVAARYDFSDAFAIRGAISNGFRGPTLPEEHFSSLNVGPTTARGLLPTNSLAAQSIGAKPLAPEKSFNLSAGIVTNPIENLHVTVDAYQITIHGRIIAGGNYTGQQALNAIELAGNTLPPTVLLSGVSAFYFSNGANTRTQGLDVDAKYDWQLHDYGALALSADLDLNHTLLYDLGTDTNGHLLLNPQGVSLYQNQTPSSKFILNALWAIEDWDVNVRETRWGDSYKLLTYQDLAPASLYNSTTQFLPFENAPRYTTDFEVGYSVSQNLRLAVGGNDVFNAYPAKVPLIGNYLGGAPFVTSGSGLGIQGDYYYITLKYTQ